MNALPFRLKIGVTGHRSGIATDALREKLRTILWVDLKEGENPVPENSILSLCGPTTIKSIRKLRETPISFCIYSALAEGADRIVAEVVLEKKDAVIQTVLPLLQEEYEEDFEAEGSRDEFRRLLQKDPLPIRLKQRRLLEECLPEQELEQRRNAYYNGGKYIVDECDILIAIWDGQPSKGRGGTYDIIEYARHVQRPLIIIHSQQVDQVKFEGQLSFYPVMFSELEHFNRFQPEKELLQQYVDELDNEYFDPKKFPEVESLNEKKRFQLSEYVFRPYAKASILARGFKKSYMLVGLLIYVFSSLAVGIVLISVIFEVLHVWAFIIEFILLSVIYTSIRFAREANVHARWLGYRFLAERIRSASYFFLAGFRFEDPLSNKTEEYTTRNDASSVMYDEIWLPVNRLRYDESSEHGAAHANPVIVEYVRKSYVDEQMYFQERYSKKHHKKDIKLEKAGRWLFFLAILAAVLHIILHFLHSHGEGMEWVNKGLTFLALMFPTLAAALEGIRHKNEYARNTHRSSLMMLELKKLSDEFALVETNTDFNNMLRKSADLILNDNEDWRNLMRERELEIVV